MRERKPIRKKICAILQTSHPSLPERVIQPKSATASLRPIVARPPQWRLHPILCEAHIADVDRDHQHVQDWLSIGLEGVDLFLFGAACQTALMCARAQSAKFVNPPGTRASVAAM